MNPRTRRILVVPSRFPFGSQEAYLTAELAELSKYFESIVVAPLRPPGAAQRHRVPAGVILLAWPLLDARILRRALLVTIARPKATLRAVVAMLRSHDPGRLKNLAIVVKALALAHYAIEERIDHIHAYWISAPATLACIAANVANVPWSSTAHRWDIYERNAFDVKERTASFVRTISTRGTTDIGRRMPAIVGRIVQVRLGTAVPPAPNGDSHRVRETLSIVCPAALVAIKDHATLFAALALVRDAHVPVRCTLAGTGPLRESLEERARALGLDEIVTFAGLVPQTTLHSWYRDGRFSVVVLASRHTGEREMEGLPSALIEAMAFGVPVVATDSGSVAELVSDECGRLVPPGDARALADALLACYREPAAARERAARGYERVARFHDVRVQMRAFARALAGLEIPS